MLVLVASSAAAHAAVVATLEVPSPSARTAVRSRAPAAAPTPDWTFTCDADAALVAGLRLGSCATPFGAGQAACAEAALARLEADRARCRAPQDVEVAFVDIDKLDLLPVPLLAEVAPVEDLVAAQLIDAEVAQKLEEATRPLETQRPTGQVIEITRPDVEVAPTDARYLSEYDSKVDKQTVARASTEEMVARPQPKDLPTTPTPPRELPPEATPAARDGLPGAPGEARDQPSMMSMREPSRERDAPEVAHRGSPGERRGAELASEAGIQPRRGDGGETGPASSTSGSGGGPAAGEGGEGGVKPPDLRPTSEVLERAVGGGSVDRIDDAETGDFTALNSRRWKFAGFFNRMKRQVAQNWHPDSVYLRRDPSGNVYGTKDRITVLQVSLTPSGEVTKVFVAQQSGVDFLDDEAVRAFREAQPFPNPPTGLVDARSNTITFSFGFHFQIGGDRSSWRVFRQQ